MNTSLAVPSATKPAGMLALNFMWCSLRKKYIPKSFVRSLPQPQRTVVGSYRKETDVHK